MFRSAVKAHAMVYEGHLCHKLAALRLQVADQSGQSWSLCLKPCTGCRFAKAVLAYRNSPYTLLTTLWLQPTIRCY